MQIIHIIPGKANPNTANGVNKLVHSVATEQIRQGFKVLVVGVASNTEKRHSPSYSYHLYKKCINPMAYPKGMLEYLLENSTENTVFHFHSVFTPWFLSLIRELKTYNRFHIFLTPHGQYTLPSMSRSCKKRIGFYLYDRRIIKEVEAVQITGYIAEDNHYLRDYAKKVVVIPNGFDVHEELTNRLSNEFIIGYMGRYEKRQKGLDCLLDGFSKYVSLNGTANLKLVGIGPDEDYLKSRIEELGLTKRINLVIGTVFRDEKRTFLKTCAALISPSRWEGFSLSCLEAASYGCPLLITEATNIGKYADARHAGITIKEPTPDAICQQLVDFERVYHNKEEYEVMRKSARDMILFDLNWTVIVKRIVTELYGL